MMMRISEFDERRRLFPQLRKPARCYASNLPGLSVHETNTATSPRPHGPEHGVRDARDDERK
jgi:hypothetical protein